MKPVLTNEGVVTNSTFTNNLSLYGAAVRTKGTDIPSVVNSIIWDNNSLVGGKPVDNRETTANTSINNSLVEGGYNGDNIITTDPKFTNSDSFDFRLANNSPAIDSGNNDAIANYDLDLAGNERITNNTVDLGAYEGSGGTAPKIPNLLDESVVIYVDKDAKGSDNGKSWTNAYTDLQDAIAAAPFGSQVWVAEGTYKPSISDRNLSFRLKDGVAIYGGFAGNETELEQRDLAENVTTLSGDIGATGDNSDNSYHVVVAEYTTNSAILDGFTISDGNANEYDYTYNTDDGGGIYAYESHAVFANLIVQNNNATDNGGGVFANKGLNQFINIDFVRNTADDDGGGLYSTKL